MGLTSMVRLVPTSFYLGFVVMIEVSQTALPHTSFTTLHSLGDPISRLSLHIEAKWAHFMDSIMLLTIGTIYDLSYHSTAKSIYIAIPYSFHCCIIAVFGSYHVSINVCVHFSA